MTRERRTELTVTEPPTGGGHGPAAGAGSARHRRSRYASSPFLAQLISERLRGISLGAARAEAPAIHGRYAAGTASTKEDLGTHLDLKV